jgi:hypothetical protein
MRNQYKKHHDGTDDKNDSITASIQTGHCLLIHPSEPIDTYATESTALLCFVQNAPTEFCIPCVVAKNQTITQSFTTKQALDSVLFALD